MNPKPSCHDQGTSHFSVGLSHFQHGNCKALCIVPSGEEAAQEGGGGGASRRSVRAAPFSVRKSLTPVLLFHQVKKQHKEVAAVAPGAAATPSGVVLSRVET
jgi:hypothetical protein